MPQVGEPLTFKHQADAVLSQANPVSATLYTVLDTARNVRIISMIAQITWATTQPTPIEIVVTIDGQTLIFQQGNPISASIYYALLNPGTNESTQGFTTTFGDAAVHKVFLFEGRSVKVQIRVTWATTQPTPLVCRVKYAKM